MLTETGRVVALERNVAWVETLRQSTCGACSARSGCGHGMLNSARADSSRAIVKALLPDNGFHVRVHDTVELVLPERSFLSAATVLYAVPLLSAVGAALVADQWLLPDGTGLATADLQVSLAAIAGLALGLLGVRLHARSTAEDPAYQPRINARIC